MINSVIYNNKTYTTYISYNTVHAYNTDLLNNTITYATAQSIVFT